MGEDNENLFEAEAVRGFVPPDPETHVSDVHYAVLYMPGRARTRFPAGCVQLMDSAEAAMASADPEAHRYAARVLGPSKSSEGQFIYYLMEWLV